MITLFQTIMKLVLKIMESLFHLNNSISNIIKVLFIITNDSIKKYGFYQTYRVLSYMRTIITHRTIISAVTFNSVIKFNSKLNKDIVNNILQAISPYLQDCINSKVSFIVFYNIFFFSVILGIIINFIITISLNILIVLLISSLAIIWNNVLSDIPFLIEWADYIISNYEYFTGFNIPRPFKNIIDCTLSFSKSIIYFKSFLVNLVNLFNVLTCPLLNCNLKINKIC